MSRRANLAVILGVLSAMVAVGMQDQLGIIQTTANIGWERSYDK